MLEGETFWRKVRGLIYNFIEGTDTYNIEKLGVLTGKVLGMYTLEFSFYLSKK